jgi:peptidoglycan hydrolase CwlO-like protein
MICRYSAFILFVWCAVSMFFALNADCGSEIITDDDLQKYKKGGIIVDNQTIQTNQPVQLERSLNKKEKQRWCDEGEKNRKQIASAEEKLREAEKDLSEVKAVVPITNKKVKSANKKKLKAEKVLKEAQGRLDELENRAHRDNVPPGWVRCQFE